MRNTTSRTDTLEILVETHSHSYVSLCGWHTHLEMAEAAADRGLQAIAITDHGPLSGAGIRHNFLVRFDGWWKGVRLIRGIEANITEEGTDVPEHWKPHYELILAGLHMNGPIDDVERNTDDVIRTIENCDYVDAITHPYIRGFRTNPERLVPVAAAHKVALELNESALSLPGRCDPDEARWMLELCVEHSCPVFVGADAHSVSEVGKWARGLALVAEVGVPHELIVNRNLDTLRAWLASRPYERSKSI